MKGRARQSLSMNGWKAPRDTTNVALKVWHLTAWVTIMEWEVLFKIQISGPQSASEIIWA